MQIPDLVVEGAGAQSLSSQQGSSLGGWGVGADCGPDYGDASIVKRSRSNSERRSGTTRREQAR
jgi:hypothetical protein